MTQYLLMPKLRTPSNMGSLGSKTDKSDTVLTTKWYGSTKSLVLGVEAREEKQDNGNNREKLAGGKELGAAVKLLSRCEETRPVLVACLKRRHFLQVYNHKHYQIV